MPRDDRVPRRRTTGKLYAAPGHTIMFRDLPFGTMVPAGLKVEIDGRSAVVSSAPCSYCGSKSVSFQTEAGYYCSSCGEI